MRIDWPEPCPMRNPAEIEWEEIEEDARKAKIAWQDHHQNIAAENRSRLSRWQIQMRDSVTVGGGKEVSKWLTPPRRPVVFQQQGKLITHPAEIVEKLKEAWEPS